MSAASQPGAAPAGGKPAAVPAQCQVQLSLRIQICSKPRPAQHGATAAAAQQPAAGSGAAALGKTQPPSAHALQITLAGLDGLEQQLPTVTGHAEQVTEQEDVDVYSVLLTGQPLSVTEQLVRSWVAAEGQLKVHIIVQAAAPPAADSKKPSSAASSKGAAAAPIAAPPVASGTLQLNCAGLLVGDMAARCNWSDLLSPPAALHPPGQGLQSLEAAAAAAAGFHNSSVYDKWNKKLFAQTPSGDLDIWLGAASLHLQVLRVPPPDPIAVDPKAGRRLSSTGGQAATAGRPTTATKTPEDPGAAGSQSHSPAPEPCSLLSPELAAVLNPVVLCPYKVANLPDVPATRQHLDRQCEPVKLKAFWPPLLSATEQPAAAVSPWELPAGQGSKDGSSTTSSTSKPNSRSADITNSTAVRTARFAVPVVFLGGTMGPQQMLQMCRDSPLVLQVHDRTALPEPPEFPIPAAASETGSTGRVSTVSASSSPASSAAGAAGTAPGTRRPSSGPMVPRMDLFAAQAGTTVQSAGGAAPATQQQPAPAAGITGVANHQQQGAQAAVTASDQGQVYGLASISMLDFARGKTAFTFAVPLKPGSTVRGAASLDWKSRPGNYMQAGALLKGWVRCAVPVQQMVVPVTTPGPRPVTAASRAGTPRGGQLSMAGAAAAPAAPSSRAAAPSIDSKQTASKAALLQQQQQQHEQHQQQQPDQKQRQQQSQPDLPIALPPQSRYQGTMTRAVFLFDYRDSDLLHTLEDTVKQHNAMVLELAPQPPEEVAAAAAVEAAAAAAAADVAAAEAAAAAAAATVPGKGNCLLRGGAGQNKTSAAAAAAANRTKALPAKTAAEAADVQPAASVGANGAAGAVSQGAGSAHNRAGAAGLAKAASATTGRTGLTPCSVLKQSTAGAAPASAAGSAGNQGPQQWQQQHARFADRHGLDKGFDSDSDASSYESEYEPTEAELRLQQVLKRYDHVELETRLLQTLSTYQMGPAQATDPALDLLTGFHLVDGTLRLVVLEGPAAGRGMAATVPSIVRWALGDGQDQQLHPAEVTEGPPWLPRRVIFNPAIRYPTRLYAELGVDLWVIKLKAHLGSLAAQPGTYASGRVRPDCIAGMECLFGLTYGYSSNPDGSSNLNSTSKSSNSSRRSPSSSPKHRSPGKSNMKRQGGNGTQESSSIQPNSRAGSQHLESSTGTVQGSLKLASPVKLSVAFSGTGNKASSGTTAGDSAPRKTGGPTAIATIAAGSMGLGRLLDEFHLFPTAAQMYLIDKKFGGELTKADLLGVEADEPDSSEDEDDRNTATMTSSEQQQQQHSPVSAANAAAAIAASAKLAALLAEGNSFTRVDGPQLEAAESVVHGGAARSRKSGKSGRLRRSKLSSRTGHSRRSKRSSHIGGHHSRRRRVNAIDMDNEVYLHLRQEAQRRRQLKDFHAEHLQALSELQASRHDIRNTWAAWNPQRAATHELEQEVAAGTITLQDTINARRQLDATVHQPTPGTLSAAQAEAQGWYPHQHPFLWPAPRSPDSYKTHPLKLSDYRVQELQEPWQKDGEAAKLATGKKPIGGADFDSVARCPPGGLFTHDAAFWQSVHQGGDKWEDEQAAAAAAAKAAWAAKAVVKDPVMHMLPGTGDMASAQADRLQNLLKGAPKKTGFKVSHTPPAPVSMEAQTPWQGAGARSIGTATAYSRAAAEKSKWVGEKDFNALCNKHRSPVAKPGFSDATTASMHDSYYQE